MSGISGTNLDTPALVVNVVIARVVPEHLLQRVPRQAISAMVVDRLHGREAKEHHGAARSHPREFVAEARANRVHEETLERVIVKCAERVRDVEAVVARVESF